MIGLHQRKEFYRPLIDHKGYAMRILLNAIIMLAVLPFGSSAFSLDTNRVIAIQQALISKLEDRIKRLEGNAGVFSPIFQVQSGLKGARLSHRKASFIRVGNIVLVNGVFTYGRTEEVTGDFRGTLAMTLPLPVLNPSIFNLTGKFIVSQGGSPRSIDGTGIIVGGERSEAIFHLDAINEASKSGRDIQYNFSYETVE
jgi:hypothetical protein